MESSCEVGVKKGLGRSDVACIGVRRAAVTGRHEAKGATGCLCTVQFARGESNEDLDVLTPVTVEGELVIRHYPARGAFPALVELQVREARRVVRRESV